MKFIKNIIKRILLKNYLKDIIKKIFLYYYSILIIQNLSVSLFPH